MNRMPRVAIAIRTILFTVAVVWAIFMIEHLATFLEIVILSFIMAAALVPAVNYFHVRHKQPRLLAVGTAFGVLVAIVVVGGLVLAPVFAEQARSLAVHLPEYTAKIKGAQGWFAALSDRFPMLPSLDDVTSKVSENASAWLKDSLGLAGKLVSSLVILVVVFVTTFFILLEGPHLKEGALSLVSPEHRPVLAAQLDPIVLKLGGYVQGMIISIAALTAYLAAILWLFHVPLALVLSLVAGFCAIVPLIGGYVGIVPIVLVALTVSWQTAVAVLILAYLGNWVVGHVLMPAVLSKSVHLSPLMVMLALLLGAETVGIFGALTAVPILAAVQVLIRNLYVEPLERRHGYTDARFKCGEPLRFTVKLEET